MSVQQLKPAAFELVPDSALVDLQRWAAQEPLRIALRHRRQGQWKAWRWIDVWREVQRLATALRQQGFVAGSRLALCGAFEPTLLLLALAARQAGGRPALVSRQAQDEALRRQLVQVRPEFAFVQRRENVAQWLRVADTQAPLRLFCAQPLSLEQGAWQVQPLSALLESPVESVHLGWKQARREAAIWCDEGSEWTPGFALLLTHWLGEGQGLAFPETSESSARDRRDIAPQALLLSPQRLQALAGEIDQRLAPPGSWRRRLCEWTLRDASGAPRRWIKARVRRLLGFQRLHRIIQGDLADAAGTAPVWLRDYLGRAA